jgi:glycine hydroxymethyltransferase
MATTEILDGCTQMPDRLDADLRQLRTMVERLLEYRKARISLISSENVTSALVRASYALGLSDQYCSRLPSATGQVGNLSFSNLGPLDEVNRAVRELVMQLFQAGECDVRPLSGLSGLHILLFSLLENDDLLCRIDERDGGHLSTGPIAKRLNIRMQSMRVNSEFRIDVDEFRELVAAERPKAVFLDSSYVLFPYPVAEMRDILGQGPTLIYDASHLIGLIGHGLFQAPFAEGADIIHATTHKTLWGPQRSMVLFREPGALVQKVQDVAKDLVSNTHLHHMLALYIALLEFKHFGAAYAHKLVQNAKSFAESLSRHGLNVAAKRYGFTQSNQVWLDLGTQERAIEAFRRIDRSNVSVNVILLPGGGWGWRLGVNELTRLGAGQLEFDALARLLAEFIRGDLNADALTKATTQLKKGLGGAKFAFDGMLEARRIMHLATMSNGAHVE